MDPDLDPALDPDRLAISKNIEKNLNFNCFNDMLFFKTGVNVPTVW
jgi:hypothetical protein